MKLVSAYVDGRDLILLHQTPEGLRRRTTPAQYDYFLRTGAPIPRGAVATPDVPGYLRVTCRRWDDRKQQIADLTRRGIPTFEGDVSPLRRYISDNPVVSIAKPRRAYYDIETDSRISFRDAREGAARVLCWCVRTAGETRTGMLADDTPQAERELLRAFWRAVADADCLLAWNGDFFDQPVLEVRSRLLGCLPAYMQRWQFLDHMVLFRRFNLNSADDGGQKESMKLNDIGQALLGHGKHNFDSSKTWEAWSAGGARRAELLSYNVQDVILMEEIEQVTGYIDLFEAIAETTLVFPDSKGLKPTHQVDGFMLRLGPTKGVRFPTKDYDNVPPEHVFRGAYVLNPPRFKGITKDVHVGDFSALYPSIIRSWNLSPETRDPGGACKCPTVPTRFRTDIAGMLPVAVAEMGRVRKHWRDLEASLPPGTEESKDAARKSMGAKVAANSFYGVVTSRFSRYYDVELGEAITQTGAWLTRDVTIPAAEAKGWHVGYADTDSILLTGCSPEEFRSFVEWCNVELYPPLLKELGCVGNYISLEYEKQFSRVVFTAAKRYAGCYAHFKGKIPKAGDKPKVRGLEVKRGDTNRLARALQEEVIALVTTGTCDDPNVALEVIRRHKRHVLHDPLPVSDVQISKSLKGPVESYTGPETPHVRVAKILRDRGEECGEGTRIAYVVTNGAASKFQNAVGKLQVIPASDYCGDPPGNPLDCDRFHLWQKMVWPATQRFVQAAFPEFDWSEFDDIRPKVSSFARRYIRKERLGQISLPGLSMIEMVNQPPERF